MSLPDQASHRWGWQARFIDGKWRVGMRGNLDTVHDAVITVHRHHGNQEARQIAEWVAELWNSGSMGSAGAAE